MKKWFPKESVGVESQHSHKHSTLLITEQVKSHLETEGQVIAKTDTCGCCC